MKKKERLMKYPMSLQLPPPPPWVTHGLGSSPGWKVPHVFKQCFTKTKLHCTICYNATAELPTCVARLKTKKYLLLAAHKVGVNLQISSTYV